MREIDRIAVEELGISLDQMMEEAGRNLADLATEMLHRESRQTGQYRVAVACGTGNNGGGGMVAARILANRAIEVSAVLAGEESRLKPAAAKRWETLKRLPVNIVTFSATPPRNIFEDADLIVDAILGYGISGTPRNLQAAAIHEILASGNKAVLSLDVPSGLDSTTGTAAGEAVNARVTLTLALPKTGLVEPGSKSYVGDLYVADIGIPPVAFNRIGLELPYFFTDETVVGVSV